MTKRGRKLTVDGVVYEYRIGTGYTVVWRDGRRVLVRGNYEIAGVTPNVFERGQRKKTQDGMVRPKHVADAIREAGV